MPYIPHLPAKLEPASIVAIIDTREQTPLDLSPLSTIRETLPTGDYSLKGLEHVVCIERKSLRGREFFEIDGRSAFSR